MVLENETWIEWTRAKREAFESRVSIFPEWVFFYKKNNRFGWLTTSLITQISNPNTIESWEIITDNGMITNHDIHWNALYVVSVWVSPFFQWNGIWKRLLTYQIELARRLWLEYIVLWSRVPDFHKFNGNIEDYLSIRDEKWEMVRSIAEVVIANYFFENNIKYEYERNMYWLIPDFYLVDSWIIVEYWWDPAWKFLLWYNASMKRKMAIYKKNNQPLISIYPKNIWNWHIDYEIWLQ